MSSQIVLNDLPLVVVTPTIDPGTLAAINEAWFNNAMQLGWFCLAVGFVIGVIAGYFYCKRKIKNAGQ